MAPSQNFPFAFAFSALREKRFPFRYNGLLHFPPKDYLVCVFLDYANLKEYQGGSLDTPGPQY